MKTKQEIKDLLLQLEEGGKRLIIGEKSMDASRIKMVIESELDCTITRTHVTECDNVLFYAITNEDLFINSPHKGIEIIAVNTLSTGLGIYGYIEGEDLAQLSDDEYIATYLRNKGYFVTASSNALKAFRAFDELAKNADAWNKADGFVPDFSDENKLKWFPWFTYDTNTEGFVSAGASAAAAATIASFGSRICFSTYERAEQFGSQFIEFWNDFLLFR